MSHINISYSHFLLFWNSDLWRTVCGQLQHPGVHWGFLCLILPSAPEAQAKAVNNPFTNDKIQVPAQCSPSTGCAQLALRSSSPAKHSNSPSLRITKPPASWMVFIKRNLNKKILFWMEALLSYGLVFMPFFFLFKENSQCSHFLFLPAKQIPWNWATEIKIN